MSVAQQGNAMPTVGRVVQDVICPPNMPLSSEKLWSGPNGKPNLGVLKDWFFREGRLKAEDVARICSMTSELLKKEPNVLNLDGSVTVCGDIHGQFYDLLKLFEIGGDPQNTIYLFLGDYVDRGLFGIECSLYLFCHKLCFPDSFILLRGNHECRHLTAYFNFKEECLYKYDEDVYDVIMDAFDCLPLAAVVNNRFFCCHGGLSPDFQTIAQVDEIERFREPPSNGAMCDILWSDPVEDESEEARSIQFTHNTTRGCSFFFGYAAVAEFLEANNLLSVLRAHEAQIEGYKMHVKRHNADFPSVITLFSAPNYCDTYANKGAVLKYHNNLMNIRQFNCNPHPYHLPNYMNVFEWSLPFVADKIAEFCVSIVNSVSKEEDDEGEAMEASLPDRSTPEVAAVVKNKIRSAAKFAVMLKALRDNKEDILEIRQRMPDNRIPPGLLQKGTAEIKKVRESFEKAKAVDKLNERRPSLDDIKSHMSRRQRKQSQKDHQ